MKRYPTEQFFQAFKDEASKWIQRFGLVSWEVNFVLLGDDECQNETEKDGAALCSTMSLNRSCDIILRKTWGIAPTEYLIRRSAYHEVFELLLSRLGHLAFHPKASEDDWEEEIHVVIRTMENVFWAPEGEKYRTESDR